MEVPVPQRPMGDLREQSRPWRCFLCPYGDHTCDVSSVEGRLLRVAERGVRGSLPVVLLEAATGNEIAVVLPEHARLLIRLLVALPQEQCSALRLRVFHLIRLGVSPATDGADGRGVERQTLRTTPVSALVLEPDLLLNITDINNAEYCVRQYPLRRMAPSAPTAATLRGTIIHSAFRDLLKGGQLDTRGALDRAMRNHTADLALRQLAADVVAAEAEPHLSALAAWYAHERNTLWDTALEVRAETFLLAPEVGLKGRLDFLMHDGRGGSLLELKTGRAHAELPKREHRWQVYGYQTLLAVRQPDDAGRPGATLLYSGTPGQAEGFGVPFALRELHRVLELRNQLALTHATGRVPAPPGAAKCARCMVRNSCLRASHLLGWTPPESDAWPEPVAPEAAVEFARFYELLRLEARATEEQATYLWRLTTEERCAAGIALGGLELLGEPTQTASGEWEYSFRCENSSELREGDEILLSDGDPVRGAVVTGTILRLTEQGVTAWTPEQIAHPRLLDRYASDIVHDRTVRNLWRWLDATPRLRALVAGTHPPAFGSVSVPTDLPGDINAEQRAAIARALAAEDFLLVQGPPGTGKTRVVAEIARRTMARGERVLVAAFTNQAVDNVLLRLVAEGVTDFVRLGHELSIATELHPYRLAERARLLAPDWQDARSIKQGTGDRALDPVALREALRRAPLIATTTATWSAERYDDTGEPLAFDLAIVDEASQLTIPALLGALRFARRFVLVGDERQLPPLVVSEEAAALGLGRSLFALLLERWGAEASIALQRQYRMHPVICGFPSTEFYGGGLVADGAARTELLDLALEVGDPLWGVLSPKRPLVFVDVAATEMPGKVSAAQAEVARRLVLGLRRAGVAASDIGVLAPYRAQVAAIRQKLAARGEIEVMVDTVDRFQGGERQVMLCSFGGRVERAHPGWRGKDFVADPHRLNVALTRAQRKLILIGDREWLDRQPPLKRLLAYCAGLYGGRGGVVQAQVGLQRAERG